MTRETALVTHPDFLFHDTGPFHPESPARLRAIEAMLARQELTDPTLKKLNRLIPEPSALEWITAVHDPGYVASVEEWCKLGLSRLPTGDTEISRASYQVALLAAGAAITAVDAVFSKQVRNAFCVVRPPGHHAEYQGGMGFCVFNTVAAAARYTQKKYGVSRVLIIDWDVHHGNGTQQIFEEDPSVLYISLHQSSWYPFTGAVWERGTGRGEGYTVNIPLAKGSGDAEYLKAFTSLVIPAAEAFMPEVVLISAGFDAHRDDPLSGTEVTEEGFDHLLRMTMDISRQSTDGRIISVLEGGYHVGALTRCVERHLRLLLTYGISKT